MKTNYFNSTKQVINFAIKQADFNFQKASDYFWHHTNHGTLDAIEYSDYVKEECPVFNVTSKDATFGIPAYEIITWIVNEGELEINDFVNLNEDNEAAMALLDFIATKHYLDNLRNCKDYI